MPSSCSNTSNTLHRLKPTLIMVLVQVIFALINVGYKLTANDGMSLTVLVAYRFLFGAAFIVPVAFFVERKRRPKLTKKIVLYGFLCGLLGGSLVQNLYLKSLALTSATFASAIINLVPAFTFIMAICLRLEKLGWNTAAGKAKVFGTLLGVGGAMLLTFYKGPNLNLWNTHINLLETTMSSSHHHLPEAKHQLGLGAILALCSCFCYSLWLIVQTKASELFPCPYSITAIMTVSAFIQCGVFALLVERDWKEWALGWNIRLLTTSFAGILGSGMMFTLIAWCVRMRGPLFVSTFNPLMLVLVAIAGSLFLEEKLHLGLLLGALLIVCGLYAVLWGTGKERKKVSQLMPENEFGGQQVEMDDKAPPQPTGGSSHGRGGGSSSRKDPESQEEAGKGEEEEDNAATSDVVGGFYVYP